MPLPTTTTDLPTVTNPGPFGHQQRKNFLFPENFTQYNHGSYGAFPKVVQDDKIAWHQHAERDIDRWMRRELRPALADIRARVAEVIHCDKDELALVTNTTVGVNTVLRSLDFQPGDRILQFSTGYMSVDKTVRYICDTIPDVQLIEVPITFPLTDQEILDKVENTVKTHQQLKDGSRIRLAMVDWISSVPSIVHPIKQLVELLQGYGILVYVDGAHSIGQVHVDLADLHPDFYITNCHKWLFSVRGSAVLYVPKHHQHLIHPTAITADYKTGFVNEFAWMGTQDYSSLMSIRSAIDFRKQHGGEDAIISYTHSLAVAGGKAVAEILGTEGVTPLKGHDHQIGNMVNIRLPIKNLNNPKVNIYLELEDFVRIGNVWKKVIDELNAE
ncbi:hypothetical protein BGZ65_005731 [Modicella reniformis]|uniref:Aminotransferase class V domain-containing protein n=1 Tax=Modicella reniformis TaxID=1440133 RepID=A0A9P6JIH7_9FUNG|nr:hypothetical protein BGZ65_005731 [Modicella reniformis]